MEMMIGYDRVILVDALTGCNGNVPGKVHRMTLGDLRNISPTQHSACAHDTSLVTALELGSQMELPLPNEISIFAIEVENVIDFCEDSTPAVAAAIPEVVEAVLAELGLTPLCTN
jgi:hydrogenase maturation protease